MAAPWLGPSQGCPGALGTLPGPGAAGTDSQMCRRPQGPGSGCWSPGNHGPSAPSPEGLPGDPESSEGAAIIQPSKAKVTGRGEGRSGGRVVCQWRGQGGRKCGGHPFINSHWGGQPHPTGLSLPLGAYEHKGEMGGTPSCPPPAVDGVLGGQVQSTLSIPSLGAAAGWGQRPRGFQEEGADHQAEIPEGPVLGVA